MQFLSLPPDTTTAGPIGSVAALSTPFQPPDAGTSGAVAPPAFADLLASLRLPSAQPPLVADQATVMQENAPSVAAALAAQGGTMPDALLPGLGARASRPLGDGGPETGAPIAPVAPDILVKQFRVPWKTGSAIAARVTTAESEGESEAGANEETCRQPAGDLALMATINAALAYGMSAMPVPVALPAPVTSVADADGPSATAGSAGAPPPTATTDQGQPLARAASLSAMAFMPDVRSERVSATSTSAVASPGVSAASMACPTASASPGPAPQASPPAEPPDVGDIPLVGPELQTSDRSSFSSVRVTVGAPSPVPSATAAPPGVPRDRVVAPPMPEVGEESAASAVSTQPPPARGPMPGVTAATEQPATGGSLPQAHAAPSGGTDCAYPSTAPAAAPAPEPSGVPVAAGGVLPQRRALPPAGVAVVEKFAAADGGTPLDTQSGEIDAVKPMVRPTSKALSKAAPVLGTATAQVPATMPAGSTPARSNAVHVNAADFGAPVRSDVAVTMAPVALPSAVHQAVEAVLNATDRLAQAPQHAVNLRFDVGGSDLNVRVALRGDTVHTTFQTDSAELRSALSTEWQAVVAPSAGDRTVRLAAPVFASNQQGGAPFSGDPTPQHHDPSPDGSEPSLPTFRGSSVSRGHGQAAGAATAPAARPASANSIHLHTLA